MAIAAFTTPACWVTVEWCLCFSLEEQRDKSHSRYWSTARFSGLSRILNHKAALSCSFIPLACLCWHSKDEPCCLKATWSTAVLARVKGDSGTAFARASSPTSQEATELELPRRGKLSGICFWGIEVPSENQSARLLKGIWLGKQVWTIALLTGNKHKRAGRVGRAQEHHQQAVLIRGLEASHRTGTASARN